MDMLCYTDIPSTLSIINIISGDQDTVSQLKEGLEKEKKVNLELTKKLSRLGDSRKNKARINAKTKLAVVEKEKVM